MKRINATAFSAPMQSIMAGAIAAALSGAAFGQEVKPKTDGAAPPAQQLETVIVTAQRRSENIRDVPLSVSTLKGDRLGRNRPDSGRSISAKSSRLTSNLTAELS